MTIRKKPSKEHEKKKESRDTALLKGTEELLGMGIDLENLEATAESVARLAAVDPPSVEAERALACWLGFAELPESAQLLMAMETQAVDKELKREIRRSLFRLEQRGIAIPSLQAKPAGAALSRGMDQGYLSAVDARGDQVAWFVREESSGDFFVLSGVIDERGGLAEADAGRVARSAFRDLLERTRSRFGLRMLPADAAWCDRLLHEAYKHSTQRRNPGVSRFPTYRMEISHQIPPSMEPPIRTLLAEEVAAGRHALLDSSARLLEEKELSTWILDASWIEPHRQSFADAAESPLVLNRYQKEERQDRALREAATAIFAGEARQVWARRLEAMAYYFHLDMRPEPARRALAVSDALANNDPQAAGSLPFSLALTRRSLETAAALERRREEEKGPSLIVKPAER
ncbi:MAG TPA: hypothetical protein VFW45_05020 [Candidatus Polarisedimenticolia bacterium]|nr:hypothetical protein [Candidatus Polarisedimenticolia bacterium]